LDIDPDICLRCLFFALAAFFAAAVGSVSSGAVWAISSRKLFLVLWLLMRRIASTDSVGAAKVACLMACGYAWKSGGGSHAADVRVGLGDDLALALGLCFGDGRRGVMDLGLRFIRACLLATGGVGGVTGG
jgi:hypothetical protein